MDDIPPDPPELETTLVPPDATSPDPAATASRQTPVWPAWVVIAGVVGLILFVNSRHERTDEERTIPGPVMIQAKSMVGIARLGAAQFADHERDIASVFGTGPVAQRVAGVVLLGELVGVPRAVQSGQELLKRLDDKTLPVTAAERRLVELVLEMEQVRADKQDVQTVFDGDAGGERREFLLQQLGWVGKLALHPPESTDAAGRDRILQEARRTAIVMLCAFGVGLLAALVGLVLQIVWWAFVATGHVTSGLGVLRGNHVYYLEAFAVWLVLFVVISRVFASPIFAGLGLFSAMIPQIGGLAALAWPVLRGTRWKDVRCDLGLTWGKPAWSPPLVGAGAYLSALPVVAVAILITFALMVLSRSLGISDEQSAGAAHPIVEPLLRGNWSIRLQILFIAVFAAVPEEIMFRGALYRHLRESSRAYGPLGSITLAAVSSSFLFAVIHPQGVMGIPILMALAIVFALVREWRGSLVPSMIAHALVNSGTTLLLLLVAD